MEIRLINGAIGELPDLLAFRVERRQCRVDMTDNIGLQPTVRQTPSREP